MQVTLCDPYLSALEAFARRRAIQIHVYFILLVYRTPCYCGLFPDAVNISTTFDLPSLTCDVHSTDN